MHKSVPGETAPSKAARGADRDVFIDGRPQHSAIFLRDALRAGNEVAGPAIIEEAVSTTLLLPGQVAQVDVYGNLVLSSMAGERKQ
jgi:N-methylhydantoinase A